MPETSLWISQKRISLDHIYLLYYISVVLWVAERNSFYHHQLMFSVSIISVNFRLISYELLPITQNVTPPLNELIDFLKSHLWYLKGASLYSFFCTLLVFPYFFLLLFLFTTFLFPFSSLLIDLGVSFPLP